MLVVFANNQTLVDDGVAAGTTITTDPVAVGENNRATGVTNIHSIFGGGAGLAWTMQGSMDGQTWVTMGPALPATAAAGQSLQGATAVTSVYARLEIVFTTAAVGATTFDIHVNFDRS